MLRIATWMVLVCLLIGCAAGKQEANVPLPNAPPPRSLAANDQASSARFADDSIYAGRTSALQGAVAVRAQSRSLGGAFAISSSATSPAVQLPPQADAQGGGAEMIDIQARFAVQCDLVVTCAGKLREMVKNSGGRITSDEANAGKQTEVTIELRVPVERFDAFASGIDGLGGVQAREIKKRDVAKEYHDSDLLLHERQVSFDRFEALLKESKTVPETIQVEQQLDRLRTEIDRIKSDMSWLKDRAAAATVVVRIFPSATSEDAVFAPEATLYPGVRATMMFDLRSETQRYGFIGAGLSIQFKPFGRALTFDVDVAHTAMTDRPAGSDYAYLFTTGFDLYSELLGGGRRKFFNPFIGFRAGLGITDGLSDFAFGGVAGVDVVKTKAALLDLHFRALGMVGNDQGPHVILGPELGFAFAF